MKVVIFGASGQLGTELQKNAPNQNFVALSRSNGGDISDASAMANVWQEYKPDVIVNAAAYTAVDLAEQEEAAAFDINSAATELLATMCARHKTRFIHVSTDFVFDGESPQPYDVAAATSPMSVYGRSKLAGEQAILNTPELDAVIIRTSWLYAAEGKNFVNTMLRLLDERGAVKVVSDQIGSPTWAASLAQAVWACVERPDVSGLHHWADLGVASWYDLAVAVAELGQELGLLTSAVKVSPIPGSEYPTPAARPSYSVLDTSTTREALGLEGTHWRTNLALALGEKRRG